MVVVVVIYTVLKVRTVVVLEAYSITVVVFFDVNIDL